MKGQIIVAGANMAQAFCRGIVVFVNSEVAREASKKAMNAAIGVFVAYGIKRLTDGKGQLSGGK